MLITPFLVSSLPSTAREITHNMDTLYARLSEEFDTVLPVPAPPPTTGNPLAGDTSSGTVSAATGGMTREWEFGRAAYLSWAVSRAMKNRNTAAGSMEVDSAYPTAPHDEGEQVASDKRLDELVKLTRQVSGAVPPSTAGDHADDAGGGASVGTGAAGLGWALQSLIGSRSESA
jgi:hypothetical protein